MLVKDAIKRARVCFVAALPILFFIAGLAWVLLFPAVSITTGELKPRGLYVDEHSLLVQSGIIGKPQVDPSHGYDYGSDICGALDRSLLRCSYAPSDHLNSTTMVQIEIDPRRAKTSFDSTLLIFRFANDLNAHNEVLRLVGSIAKELTQSRWNTRKVVILLLPSSVGTEDSPAESAVLHSWLQRHHQPTFEQIVQSELRSRSGEASSENVQHILQVGAIREAYIIDLTDSDVWTTPSTNAPSTTATTTSTAVATTTTTIADTLHFTTATLQHTGVHGLLPNMDIIAYPLSLYPRILQSESQVCGEGLYLHLHSLYGGVYGDSDNSITAWLLRPLIQQLDIALPHAYKMRLLSLLCTIHTLSTNTATGLHGYFSHLNIDSITIKPTLRNRTLKPALRAAGFSPMPGSNARSRTGSAELHDVSTLLQMVMSLVYVSNNLQEELHHSHFYYLMMGSGHFVGIYEYGFTAVLFLASVLCMFVQLCSVNASTSMTRVTGDSGEGTCVGAGAGVGVGVGADSGVSSSRGVQVMLRTTLQVLVLLASLVPVVSVVLWALCVPAVYKSALHERCNTITTIGLLIDELRNGSSGVLLQVLNCALQHVRTYVLYYIPPVENIGSATLTLCLVVCVTALLCAMYDRFCVGVDGNGSVSCDSKSIASGANNGTVDLINCSTSATPSKCTTLTASVHTLFVLITLAYLFAFNFSLGLVVAVIVTPCLLVVTYVLI